MRAIALSIAVLLCALISSADPLQRKTAAAAVPCVPNTEIIVTDDATAGACAGGGAVESLCICSDDGTAIAAPGVTGASGSHPIADGTEVVQGSDESTRQMRFELDMDLDGNAGVTAGNTRVMHVPDEDIDLHDSQTDHEERYGVFNVLDYGAISDGFGVTDDTDGIQAAITACEARNIAEGGGQGTVLIPPGQYDLSDTATAHVGVGIKLSDPGGCHLRGSMSSGGWGAAFSWTGTNDVGTAIEVVTTGGGIHSSISHLDLRGSEANRPEFWIEYTGAPDKYSSLSHIKMQGAGMKFTNWTNLHMEHMRFDGPAGYAILFQPTSANALRSFNISNWTFAVSGTGSSAGVFKVEPQSNANFGAMRFANARLESDTGGFTNGRILEWDEDTSGGEASILFENISAQMTSVNTCFLGFTKSSGASGFERTRVTVSNSEISVDETLCGDWGATAFGTITGFDPGLEISNWSIGHKVGMLYNVTGGGAGVEVVQSADNQAYAVYNTDDAESVQLGTRAPALKIEGDGDLSWSSNPGTADDDVRLSVNAANELDLEADNCLCFSGSGTQCICYNAATTCLYADDGDKTCELGEELSANCTACP